MMWLLWVVTVVLAIIVIAMFGYFVGKNVAKEEFETKEREIASTIDLTPIPMTFNQTVSADPEDVYRAVKDILEANPPKAEPGKPGPGPETWQVDENFTLPEWVEHVNSRLSRVERKAGLNV